jgi:hypothetical protein
MRARLQVVEHCEIGGQANWQQHSIPEYLGATGNDFALLASRIGVAWSLPTLFITACSDLQVEKLDDYSSCPPRKYGASAPFSSTATATERTTAISATSLAGHVVVAIYTSLDITDTAIASPTAWM